MKKYLYNKDSEYNKIYGGVLHETDDLVENLQKKFNISSDDLTFEEERIKNIPYETINIVLMMVPKGAPRPRSSGDTHFYVKDAAKTRRLMRDLIDSGVICTGTELYFDFYLPTPINKLSGMDIILAEKKLIRPLIEPDYDNLPKGYTDALQNVLLLNDKIVYRGYIDKYYSLEPRIDLTIKYRLDHDCVYNKEKIINSKNFRDLIK